MQFTRGDTETVGAYLRRVREARGLSREQVAVDIGGTAGTVTAWESGYRRCTGPAARTLAREYGVEVWRYDERDERDERGGAR